MGVAKLLLNGGEQYAERNCTDFYGAQTSYAEMAAKMESVAAGLQRLGVRKGDRVALCLPNCPAYLFAFMAIARIGGVVVNINPLLTHEEMAHELKDTGASIVITADVARIYDRMVAVGEQVGVRKILVVSLSSALPPLKRFFYRILKYRDMARVQTDDRIEWLDSIMQPDAMPQPVTLNPHDLVLLQFTGGTTGTPKAAMLTHANLLANTEQVCEVLGQPRAGGEMILLVLPLFHVFAMTAGMNMGLAIGATIALLPHFKMPEFLAAVKRVRPSLLPGVPTLFNALANEKKAARAGFGCVRFAISGGAALSAEIRARFATLTDSALVEGYGLTEASPVVACGPREGNRQGSAGLALRDVTIEIRDDKGKALPVGQTGELWVRGPQVMQGYWLRAEETADVLKNGWLRTGDIGYVDSDGWLFITDRLKDIIISNGYNVYPRVIEDALLTHPAVAEVAVIGIADPHKGEVAKAFVVLKPDAPATEADLLAFATGRLNPIERPRAVEIRDSLPKTAVGKVSRKELRTEENNKRKA